MTARHGSAGKVKDHSESRRDRTSSQAHTSGGAVRQELADSATDKNSGHPLPIGSCLAIFIPGRTAGTAVRMLPRSTEESGQRRLRQLGDDRKRAKLVAQAWHRIFHSSTRAPCWSVIAPGSRPPGGSRWEKN